jgi:hypothetical protein
LRLIAGKVGCQYQFAIRWKKIGLKELFPARESLQKNFEKSLTILF